MGLQLFIGLAILGVLTWLAGGICREKGIISEEDAGRIWLTSGLLFIAAIILAIARAFDSKVPATLSLLFTTCVIIFLMYFWLPRIGRSLLGMITTSYDGGDEQIEAKPFYHRATAYRKQGKYQEALDEIRQQLELFPDDAEGLMLTAEVQSDDLKDIPAALGTLTAIIALPNSSERDRVLAHSRMADLYLRVPDVPAAKRSLEAIVKGWPDTDAARLATQRIHHLPGAEFIEAQRERAPIVLGNYEKNLGLKSKADPTRDPGLATPAQQASVLLNRIVKAPEDWEAREQLAILYARQFRRYDMAKDQLETLLGMSSQPDRAVVRWLNLLADLQLDAPDGIAQARETLERIVKRFPGTPYADTAASRAARLGLETKAREIPKTIKLGVYEKNIGLKTDRPPEEPAAGSEGARS